MVLPAGLGFRVSRLLREDRLVASHLQVAAKQPSGRETTKEDVVAAYGQIPQCVLFGLPKMMRRNL